MSDQSKQVIMKIFFKHKDGFEENIKLEGSLRDCRVQANHLLKVRGGKDNMLIYHAEHHGVDIRDSGL